MILCYSCGNVFPVYEAHFESKIKDSLETTDDPFEGNESIFMSVGRRKKKDRLNKYQNEDPDIQAELRKGNTVNILYSLSCLIGVCGVISADSVNSVCGSYIFF